MSKYQYRTSDIYLPGTEIPVNRLEIEDAELLHAVEAELLEEAYDHLTNELTPRTRFDEGYFRDLHRRTFESLYDWAGQYRHEDMSKGGSMFCRGAYVAREASRIFTALERDHALRSGQTLPPERFAERLAAHQSEIIALHPFYELNGRITRLFFDLIAIHNGYGPIDYEVALADDLEVGNNYIRASIDCVQRADHRQLAQLIFAGLHRMENEP